MLDFYKRISVFLFSLMSNVKLFSFKLPPCRSLHIKATYPLDREVFLTRVSGTLQIN